MICPVCKSEKVSTFFKDLSTCGSCTHIFKNEPVNHNLKSYFNLEHYSELTAPLTYLYEQLETGTEFEFIFPSVVFYGNRLSQEIYTEGINHYFTQNSMMRLMEIFKFKVKKQDVRWAGNMCETFLKVVK